MEQNKGWMEKVSTEMSRQRRFAGMDYLGLTGLVLAVQGMTPNCSSFKIKPARAFNVPKVQVVVFRERIQLVTLVTAPALNGRLFCSHTTISKNQT